MSELDGFLRPAHTVSAQAPAGRMTHAECCAFGRDAALEHEYLRGEVFAMAGG
ncbi:hypothetical protein ENSA5_19350 [Enhygromyxa salina]|uniref:Uncharacterized protein n=1 Tax=Enhygromyxa salina TaxID=215803 RepID=A0A2S9YDA0_9BACT|nr:hypothetical protein [Enhygromyxa salina]PRQ02996.1 hypothetical protein ENSA5_19350 [Enhygromyxa salina]